MSFGKAKRAWINLKSKEVSMEHLDEKYTRKWGGMRGLALPIMLKEIEKDTDPLGPLNLLIVAAGLLNGLGFHGTCRYGIYAKSPLTGGFGGSDAGGYFGPALRAQGVDALVFKERAEKPVYIWIEDGKVEIKDATDLWGLETGPALEKLREKHGKVTAILIGPAGENQVRFACVINDLHHVNGRTGMGAVMGSKNIKAIVAPYPKAIPPKDPVLHQEMIKVFSNWKDDPLSFGLHVHGTAGGVTRLNRDGILPTMNFQQGTFEGASSIDGKLMTETLLKERLGCFACAVRCKRVVGGGKYDTDPNYGGPEYETMAALGSLCGVDDLDAVTKGHELCNRFGLDTISAGMTIAWLMECVEKGIMTKDEAIVSGFGDAQGMLKLLEKIARREGIGDLLADGSKRASAKVGKGSEKFLMTVKGQELPMHEPRGKKGVAIGYALSPTGADHMQFAHDPLFASPDSRPMKDIMALGILEPLPVTYLGPEKIRAITYLWYFWAAFNHLGCCYFVFSPRSYFPIHRLHSLVEAATGWNITLWELMKMGERGLNAARLFNLKMGLTSEDDVIPERLHTPLPDGAFKGSTIGKDEFKDAVALCYSMMGWDGQGIPKREKLAELGLEEFI